MNRSSVDYKNIIWVLAMFSVCLITGIVYGSELALKEDIIYELLVKVSYAFTFANVAAAMEQGDIAALMVMIQGIQIINFMKKFLEQDGWKNKILFWIGVLFLELFLSFTAETYKEESIETLRGTFFIIIGVSSAIYSIYIMISSDLCLFTSPLEGCLAWIFTFMKVLLFTNPIAKYLWTYTIGFFGTMLVLTGLIGIPSMLKAYAVSVIISVIATPFLLKIDSWIVQKCLGFFFEDLYDVDEICTLDIIGMVIAVVLLLYWLITLLF